MTYEDLHRIFYDTLGDGSGSASRESALLQAIAPYLHTHKHEPKIDREARYEEPAPTIYSGVRCERCGKKGTCFSVLCSLKCGGHYVSGNKLLCMSCIKTELAELAGGNKCLVDQAFEEGLIGVGNVAWATEYCKRDHVSFDNYCNLIRKQRRAQKTL